MQIYSVTKSDYSLHTQQKHIYLETWHTNDIRFQIIS